MADTVVLKAETRSSVGSKDAGKVRAAGRIPAIVYGHKQDPVSISVDSHNFVEVLHHGQRLLDVDIDGKSQKLLVKDLQYDHLGRSVIHADFVRVDLTETVKVSVAIELKGTAHGTTEGGIIDEQLNELEVECVVTNIPDAIEVLVKDVNIGDVVHAGDIELPDGVKLITDVEAVVLTCHVVAAAKSTEEIEEEEELTAPEVITEKKEEGESSEDQG
jgi:large subunit ribosomal protein L25